MPEQADRDRWAQLAAELGLDTESPPESTAPPAPPPPVRREEPPAPVAVPAAPEVEIAPPAKTEEDEEPARRSGRRRRVEELPTETVAEAPFIPEGDLFGGAAEALEDDVPETVGENSPAAESEAPQEERRPGRRRRRRSGRGKPIAAANGNPPAPVESTHEVAEPVAEESPAPDEEGETPAESESGDSAEGGRSRRRRRGRKKPPVTARAATPREDTAEEPELVPVARVEPVKDDDDSGNEDLTNWDIPPWQEIIDSLYRPGR